MWNCVFVLSSGRGGHLSCQRTSWECFVSTSGRGGHMSYQRVTWECFGVVFWSRWTLVIPEDDVGMFLCCLLVMVNAGHTRGRLGSVLVLSSGRCGHSSQQ